MWTAVEQFPAKWEINVCLCFCMFSLMDLFLPRSSRRPSSFLLQDAHPTSVCRRLHLQIPTATSIVPSLTLHLTAAQPNTHTHILQELQELSWVHLPPIINELFCIYTQALDWRQGFGSNRSNHTHAHARNLGFLKNQDLLFIFWCNSKDWWWSWTKKSLPIKVVCFLATLKKTHYMHKYTV